MEEESEKEGRSPSIVDRLRERIRGGAPEKRCQIWPQAPLSKHLSPPPGLSVADLLQGIRRLRDAGISLEEPAAPPLKPAALLQELREILDLLDP